MNDLAKFEKWLKGNIEIEQPTNTMLVRYMAEENGITENDVRRFLAILEYRGVVEYYITLQKYGSEFVDVCEFYILDEDENN